MRHNAAHITEEQFPTRLLVDDLVFSLCYHFEPGHADDGVTVTVPLGLLNRIPKYRFEWLVAGLLRDKCIALLKSLPKQYRKQLVPVPDYVDKILSRVSADNSPLLQALTRTLKSISGVDIPLELWRPDSLEDFYRMNIHILGNEGELLGRGRDVEQLLSDFSGQVSETLQQQSSGDFSQKNVQCWDFGELPEYYQFEQAGVTVTSYPALVDCKDSVAIELQDYPRQATLNSRRGMVRLLMLQLPQQVKYLRKELLKGNALLLQLAGASHQREQWLEDLLFLVFYAVFLQDQSLPRTESEFEQCLQVGKGALVEEANRRSQLLSEIADGYNAVRKRLKKANQLSWAMSVADIKNQLDGLLTAGFIADTPWHWLEQYPRYLQAIELRLEKLQGNFQKDKQQLPPVQALQEPLQAAWKNNAEAALQGEDLLQFRWLLEEYRVSLFAQQLGTQQPVSEKRLRALWKQIKQS